MDSQVLLTIVFVLALCVLLWFKRKNVEVRGLFPLFYFVMYKTKLGIKSMDGMARSWPRLVIVSLVLSVIVGFVGMALISYELVKNSVSLFFKPGTGAGIQPVLPFEAKGVFFVPFVYWILSIFVIAVVHEFSHGVAARRFGFPIKSSGWAFLGVLLPIVPAAFVEPDEKKLQKDKAWKQLCVFAAGPVSNLVVAGIVMLVIVFAANPLAEAMLEPAGVRVIKVLEDSPAARDGLQENDVITGVDGVRITHVQNLTRLLATKKPEDRIVLNTERAPVTVGLGASPKNASLAYLGIQSRQHAKVKPGFPLKWASPIVLWSFGLLYWLFLLSVGIGLFNLLPIGPIDGGRMLHVGMQFLFDEKRGTWLWKSISMIFLFLVITNVIAGFVV